MSHSISHLNLTAAKNHIDQINFSMIIRKMVNHGGWQKKNALALCQMYRNYLYLLYKYRSHYSFLPPSEEIDEFWHHHILDTHKYAQDCQAIFGEFLHHYPYLGLDARVSSQEINAAFASLQELYFQEFGSYIYKIKKRNLFYPAIVLMKKLTSILYTVKHHKILQEVY